MEDLADGARPDFVIAQMAIGKAMREQIAETAGKAGIDFLLYAAPAIPITTRSYRYVTHLLVNETGSAIMLSRQVAEVNQTTWPETAQEFSDRGVKNVIITRGGSSLFRHTY